MTECQSPLPQEGGGAVGDAFASQRPILTPIGELLPKEGAYVTGLAFVSLQLHDEVPEPPSFGRQKPCRGLLSRANM